MLRKFEGAHFVRVRYSETDKMGFCYYGNYAAFLELGRVELLWENKIVYKELEDLGILLPVSELSIKYLHPAKYDDLLKIKTTISDLKGARIFFNYEIYNEEEDQNEVVERISLSDYYDFWDDISEGQEVRDIISSDITDVLKDITYKTGIECYIDYVHFT